MSFLVPTGASTAAPSTTDAADAEKGSTSRTSSPADSAPHWVGRERRASAHRAKNWALADSVGTLELSESVLVVSVALGVDAQAMVQITST